MEQEKIIVKPNWGESLAGWAARARRKLKGEVEKIWVDEGRYCMKLKDGRLVTTM